jgi:hypothetical protein
MMNRSLSTPPVLHVIGFAVILDDVGGCLQTLREARVMHVAPERFRLWPLEAKATPFSIATPTMT